MHEYKTLKIPDLRNMDEAINKIAKEGWKLIKFVPSLAQVRFIVVFEREIITEKK